MCEYSFLSFGVLVIGIIVVAENVHMNYSVYAHVLMGVCMNA